MTIDVYFKAGSAEAYTKTVTQHDKGVRLRMMGISLPDTFEVHFSNRRDGGMATVVPGKNYLVGIPDAYLDTGEYVYAWIYVEARKPTAGYVMDTTDEILSLGPTFTYGEEVVPGHAATAYRITIPVQRRPVPVTVPEVDPEEEYIMPSGSEDVYEYTLDGENLILTLKTH